ncbi:MAG: hypothetical protein VZS44_09175 [Bacilli bacterium]|nr:hypothetical protein [Bacilli bacterium]
MANINDNFLEMYKELETELRGVGLSVLDYENNLPDGTEKEKLKLCRIIRNYMSHQDKKFVVATQDMVNFIGTLAINIRRKTHIVANELIKQKTVKYNEYLKNVLPLLVKISVPVVDNNGTVIYIMDANDYIKMLNKGLKRIELPKKLPKLNYTDKDTKIEDLAEGIYVVTSTGNAEGKYLGICIV